MKTKLSRSVADAALPQSARYTIWDAALPAFGLRVEPSGRKTFVVRYLADGGGRGAPQRQATIGPHGTLTLAQARKKAKDILADVRRGGDPMGDLAARRKEMTIAGLIELYEKEGCVILRGKRRGTSMKPLTKAYTLARLRHHVVPLLGSKRISEVTAGDIRAFARNVANGRTARDEKVKVIKPDGRVTTKRIIVRGGAGAARKVVRDLSAVFTFARLEGLLISNPVDTAPVNKVDNQRQDAALNLEEIKRLGTALDELEADGVNRKATNITRLWALTGCRRNEIAGLKWTEVDLQRGLLIFDDTKTGRSVRPLGTAAWALLRGLSEGAEEDAEFVFPAARGDGFYSGTKRIWPEIVRRARLPGVTPHSLRHTLGGAAASSGEALLLVGAILGHANARSTQIYAKVANDPARLAADRATAGIAAALGQPVLAGGNTSQRES